MTTQFTKQPGDTTEIENGGVENSGVENGGFGTTPRAETVSPSAAAPSTPSTEVPRRPRITGSPWWRWGRGVFAALLLLVMVGQWLVGGASQLLMFSPVIVLVATVVQRVVAKIQGQLVGFAPDPFDRANRPYVVQFVIRGVLAALVAVAIPITVPRFALTDTEYVGLLALAIVPALLFAALQLIPARTVSRALNLVAIVAAAFLAFQLVQVHFRSGLDDAVELVAPFEDGEWTVTSGGKSTLVSHHYALAYPQQKYALDFVVLRDGRVHEGDADDPASYYAWNEPLLAPADGVVVEVEDGLRDWPVGQREADVEKATGNYVTIDIGDGQYVVLAHVRQGTVTVAAGDRVTVGQVIGRVGNSGNTGMPHLHLQVQDSPDIASDMFSDVGSYPMSFSNITQIRGGTEYEEQHDLLRRDDIMRVDDRSLGGG
ncbi:MAG: peptidoglycan DD-metalloendopeptidase family protein [Acidimicrobiia bacterium]|nr:peptidoglycan DD-metalloendopeptidase family protein [Acidimicrobiia bacterium]